MGSAIASFLAVFTIGFIFLKLTGLVSWSWWWLILSPIWLSIGVYLVAFLIAIIIIIINGNYQK